MLRIALGCFILAAALGSLRAHGAITADLRPVNYYGRIEISAYPPPWVIYPRPVAIERVHLDHPPIYMRVPEAHARQWSHYCRQYRACDQRVLFVQESWYQDEYLPRYEERHRLIQAGIYR